MAAPPAVDLHYLTPSTDDVKKFAGTVNPQGCPVLAGDPVRPDAPANGKVRHEDRRNRRHRPDRFEIVTVARTSAHAAVRVCAVEQWVGGREARALIRKMDGGAELGRILSGSVVSLLVMTEIQLLRPEGLFASPAFSHVAVVPPDATTVYVGGQNAVDQNGELVGGTDVAAQTRQVMANLATALEAAGAGIEHLADVLVVEGVDVQAAYAAAAATLSSAKAPPLVSRQRRRGRPYCVY
jgi:enamine deaminase RidA (YjgF/YER057c/UK114 family)